MRIVIIIFFFLFLSSNGYSDTKFDVDDDIDYETLVKIKKEFIEKPGIPRTVRLNVFNNSDRDKNFQIIGTNIHSNVSFVIYGEINTINKAVNEAYLYVTFCKKDTACTLNEHRLFTQYYIIDITINGNLANGIKINKLEFQGCEFFLEEYENYCKENYTKLTDRRKFISLWINYEDFTIKMGHNISYDATEMFINKHSKKKLLDFGQDYHQLRNWYLRNPLLDDKMISLTTLSKINDLKLTKSKNEPKNKTNSKKLLKKLLGMNE